MRRSPASSGSERTARTLRRRPGSKRTISTPLVARVLFFASLPSTSSKRASRLGLTCSMTPYARASSALRLRLLVTNSRAAVVFLPFFLAFSSARATTALITLVSLTGSVPVGPIETGWAEPMIVPGTMAAMSEERRMIVPALQAVAPEG
ncbi:MAG: hypothetical protein A4E50_01581 [Methanosaeta sp. PtaB.Bin087]|nr:MAG: hypothetical protein A4E50_01581 [Methanosaeta sp. PtaB.Bin087]